MRYAIRNEYGEIVDTIDYELEERTRIEYELEDYYAQMEEGEYDDAEEECDDE